MVNSCVWFFGLNESGYLLEDDCIPSSDFFDFIDAGLAEIVRMPNVLMVCGTQFFPPKLSKEPAYVSKYPFIWGWGTTKNRWATLLSLLELGPQKTNILSSDSCFWNSGARRAFDGFVDAWDLPLVANMIHAGKFVLLPGRNLVKNIGDDSNSTHHFENSPWTHLPVGSFIPFSKPPIMDNELENWIRTNFYQISTRHILSTKIRWLMDFVFQKKVFEKGLLERIRL